jgi:hypothetical protein
MAKIITENFKVENTNELYDSFIGTDDLVTSGFGGALLTYSNNFADADNPLTAALTTAQQTGIKNLLDAQIGIHGSSAEYYIMASSYTEDSTITNSQYSKRLFQRRVIFGNKVPVDDVRYMFNAPLWISGTVYDDFDDTEDTSTKNLFVHVVDGTNTTHIFKCLENNNDSVSTQAPSLVENYINTISGDGYVWHYMFSVSENQKLVFSTSNSLPFPSPGNAEVIANAKEGISQIKIAATQSNLFSKCVFDPADNNPSRVSIPEGPGVLIPNENGNRNVTIRIANSANTLDALADSYSGLYLWSSAGELFEVINSTKTDSANMLIKIKASTFSVENKTFELLPKIDISQSDGTQALAYGIIDKDGTLVKIGYKDRGSGYKCADASVVLPLTVGTPTVATTLRCVVSPTGGHGSKPVNEMAMSKLAVITNFSGTSVTVPDTGDYTKVALVKNPLFVSKSTGVLLEKSVANPQSFDNRLVVTLQDANNQDGDFTGSVLQTYTISQVSGTETITALIHEVEYDAVNQKTLIYLVDYTGSFYSKFTTGTVTINGNTMSINITNASYGDYSAHSGEILHFLDFDPITRDLDRKEKIKFIFDF